jgi:hypothetical protein
MTVAVGDGALLEADVTIGVAWRYGSVGFTDGVTLVVGDGVALVVGAAVGVFVGVVFGKPGHPVGYFSQYALHSASVLQPPGPI